MPSAGGQGSAGPGPGSATPRRRRTGSSFPGFLKALKCADDPSSNKPESHAAQLRFFRSRGACSATTGSATGESAPAMAGELALLWGQFKKGPEMQVGILPAVTATPYRPEGPAPASAYPRVQATGRTGTAAMLQAAVFMLLAWVAVLCTGLGGTVGAASQSLANKLAPHAQHWQRQAGTQLSSRAIRRDHIGAAPAQQVAETGQASAWDPPVGALPATAFELRVDTRSAHAASPAAFVPHLKPRNRAHPNRAPPGLA